MIAIVDYGSGNVNAIVNIYKHLKIPHILTSSHREIIQAEKIILPGVGAFDTTMIQLRKAGLVSLLNDQVLGEEKTFLGVCVGMQILASGSDEGDCEGFGWISGKVRKIESENIQAVLKTPHMGWNSIEKIHSLKLLHGIDLNLGFYFLHSYYFDAENVENIAATVTYGSALPCVISKGRIFGTQFHPEKSHANGITLFRNFASI